MHIDDEIKSMFDGKRVIPLATVDEAGMPTVAPMLMYVWHGDDEFVIADLFMKATKENVISNGKASVSVWEGPTSYKLRGPASYVTEGPAFDTLITAKPGLKQKAKGAVVLKVTEVFDASKGTNAGKLIAKQK
jgi:predicted pyridoxine 5'-phosphate oxidase superfamily flavin-nucleotide-binding protein